MKFLPATPVVELLPGLAMQLDLRKANQRRIFFLHEEYEPALQYVIRSLLPEEGVFIDCGANTGLFGFLAIHFRRARVFFVEPHPEMAQILEENLRRNGFENRGAVWNVAASDGPGTIELFEGPPEQFGGHTVVASHSLDPNARRFRVKRERLEELIGRAGLGRVDLLKVDCEFHDLEALQGAGECLRPDRIKLVYAEMSGEQFEPVANLLSSRGYRPIYTHKISFRKLRRPGAWDKPENFFLPSTAKPRRRDVLWVDANKD